MARSIALAVRGARGMGDLLTALAHDAQRAMPAVDVQMVDVRAQGFGDPQPVQGEQRRQGMVTVRRQPGRHEERAELVAVQPERAGLVVLLRTADVGGR